VLVWGGVVVIADVRAYLLNEWALVQFAHNQAAALVTGTFVISAVGAFYLLRGEHREQGRLYLHHGVAAALALVYAFAVTRGYRRPDAARIPSAGSHQTSPPADIS
jgi:cytochrome bd-type quinol oxidase subunit 1